MSTTPNYSTLIADCAASVDAAATLVEALKARLRERLGSTDDGDALAREQAAAHGFAWAAT